jgi:hypothetical protein
LRDEIADAVIDSYAVVLMFESVFFNKNKKYKDICIEAISRIRSLMFRLPKPIRLPPQLITISPETALSEKILLWSLNIKENLEYPEIVVIYGRCRRMGFNIKTPDVGSARLKLLNILAVIGADCECGLDRSWMQDVSIPLKWDPQRQQTVVNSLGFDPENPMVKIRMSQILSYRGIGIDEVVIDGLIAEGKNTDINSNPSLSPSQIQSLNEPKRQSLKKRGDSQQTDDQKNSTENSKEITEPQENNIAPQITKEDFRSLTKEPLNNPEIYKRLIKTAGIITIFILLLSIYVLLRRRNL